MFKIYSEDCALDEKDCLFSSKDKAIEWVKRVISTHHEYFTNEDEQTDTVESLEKDGYFEIVEMTIDPEYIA